MQRWKPSTYFYKQGWQGSRAMSLLEPPAPGFWVLRFAQTSDEVDDLVQLEARLFAGPLGF